MFHTPLRITRCSGVPIHVLPVSHMCHALDSISYATCYQWSATKSEEWHHQMMSAQPVFLSGLVRLRPAQSVYPVWPGFATQLCLHSNLKKKKKMAVTNEKKKIVVFFIFMFFAFYFILFTNVKNNKIKFQISKFENSKKKERKKERKKNRQWQVWKKKWWDNFLILFYLKYSWAEIEPSY